MEARISGRTIVVAVVAAVLVASAPALAKGGKKGQGAGGWEGHGEGMMMKKLFKALDAFEEEIGLTAKQRSKIDAKVEALKESVAPLREEARTLRKELLELVKAKKLDKAKIKAKHAELQAVHQKMAEKRFDTALEVLEILDADQRALLVERIGECQGKMCAGDCPCPGKGKGKGK